MAPPKFMASPYRNVILAIENYFSLLTSLLSVASSTSVLLYYASTNTSTSTTSNLNFCKNQIMKREHFGRIMI